MPAEKTIRTSLVLFSLAAWSGIVSSQTLNGLTAREQAQGWQLLFDGKTMEGWHSSAPVQARGRSGAPQPAQPGAAAQIGSSPKPCAAALTGSASAVPAGGSHWEVADGVLIPCGEPAGYLTSDQSYRNFVLSIEFKCGEETNSGVFIRSPQESGGYEVQIWKHQPAGYNTGAIVGTAKTAREFTFKPDQWNHYQITADGDHIVVALNGETTLDIHDTKFPEGHLRLQYQQFPIAFRNIKLRLLS
jgi:3-keto-disaccharide hydrolase